MTDEFVVSLFDDVYGRAVVQEKFDIEMLHRRIEATHVPKKEHQPALVLGTFGNQRSAQGSFRHAANLTEITGAVADHDAGSMAFSECVDRLRSAGVSFVAYTTASHTPAAPRWRAICPFSAALPPARLAQMTARLNGILDGAAGPESWHPAQAFYHGVVGASAFESASEDTKEFLDQADETDIGAIGPQSSTTKPNFKKLDEFALRRLIETGQNYNGAAQELLWRWARAGVKPDDAEANLRACFDRVPTALHDKKWTQRRAQIARWTARVFAKLAKKLTGTFGAVVAHLEESPHWDGAVRLNRLVETVEVCEPFPPQEGQAITNHRPLREPRDVLETMLYLQNQGLDARKNLTTEALILVAERHSYHPVMNWLADLRWDGQERAARVFLDYFPAELPEQTQADRDQASRTGDPTARARMIAYLEHVGHNFLVAGVARMLQPGCKHDHLPVIVGPQAWNKSRGLAALMPVPAWFSDDISTNLIDRDTKESLVGKWLLELAEVPHLKREVEKVKAFFSRSTDRFRRAYDRLSADWPRTCFFCGTSNELVLHDTTGNRRYWPVQLDRPADIAAIERDRDQLWAEAQHCFKRGDIWWNPPTIELIAREKQALFVEEDIWDEPIAQFVEQKVQQRDTDGNVTKHTGFALVDVLVGMGFSADPSADMKRITQERGDAGRAVLAAARLGARSAPLPRG